MSKLVRDLLQLESAAHATRHELVGVVATVKTVFLNHPSQKD